MGLTITDFSPTCISNLSLPGMLHGITIRSHKSHGRLLHIRTPELPEGYRMFTGRDLGDRNNVEIWGCTVPLFAADKSAYIGEPVGLLVGPDLQILEELLTLTQVTFEELEPQFSREDTDTRRIVLARHLDYGSIEHDFADSEQVVEGVYRTGIQDHHYLEPMGALAAPAGTGMQIYSPCTHIYLVQDIVAQATGIARKNILVEACFPGDDLDGKLWYPAVIAAQAAFAAREMQQAVHIQHDHVEDGLYSPKRAPATIRIATGISSDGEKRTLRAELDIDMGSYPVGGAQLLERAMLQICGRYRLSSLQVIGRILHTNTPPLGFFDGWGDAAAAFAIETHYNRAAEVAMADPADFRSRNLVAPGERLITGGLMREMYYPQRVLEAVVSASDFTRKHAAYELQRKRRSEDRFRRDVLRGIGIAQVSSPPMLIGTSRPTQASSAGIRLESDGTATILTSMYPGSSGAELAWRSVVAEALGLSISKTRIAPARTDTCPDTGPETLSRGITICSRVLETCAQAINKRRFRDPLPIEIHRSFRLPKTLGQDADGIADPYPFAATGAAVIEVEIEQHTLSLSIRGIWLAVNGGRIIQSSAAMQRLEQSIYSALGFLHTEVLELHAGMLSPSHTVGYRIPRFGDFPDPHIQLIQPDRKAASLGVGEIPGMCIPAAGIQAVSQASGVYFDQVPITPEIMYQYRTAPEETEPFTQEAEE
ncbi:MAG: xanthine dehydrogenase family protein molybdopterin-binding subunit [Spirochaeta sp.]